jgi:hypothetical protein
MDPELEKKLAGREGLIRRIRKSAKSALFKTRVCGARQARTTCTVAERPTH